MNLSQNPLEEYFYDNRRNIIHKWTQYFDVYHRHFQKFVGKKCVVFEIGVSQDGSFLGLSVSTAFNKLRAFF